MGDLRGCVWGCDGKEMRLSLDLVVIPQRPPLRSATTKYKKAAAPPPAQMLSGTGLYEAALVQRNLSVRSLNLPPGSVKFYCLALALWKAIGIVTCPAASTVALKDVTGSDKVATRRTFQKDPQAESPKIAGSRTNQWIAYG